MNALHCFAAASLPTLLLVHAHAADGDAYKKVAQARLFAFGGIGVAGITAAEEIAFREILASRTAESDLTRLFKSGNDQAKCYALVGLKLKNRAAFEAAAKTVATSGTEVETAAGCVLMKQPMSSVVAAIGKGSFDQQAQREIKR